jgi:hypothetical protein
VITVCEDETFHPEIYLVAIEPVSNFIVLEKYVPNRKAETWTAALNAGIGMASTTGPSIAFQCKALG